MYADDTVLVASKEEELKSMIGRLEKYLDKRKFLVNVDKSKMLVFSKGGRGGSETEWRGKDENSKKSHEVWRRYKDINGFN